MVGRRRSLLLMRDGSDRDERTQRTGDRAVVRCEEPISVDRLRAELSDLDTEAVVIASEATTTAQVARLAAADPPCVTARPVSDALKRVSHGMLMATVDRNELVSAGLPMVLRRDGLLTRLQELAGRDVEAGLLLTPGQAPSFVDP